MEEYFLKKKSTPFFTFWFHLIILPQIVFMFLCFWCCSYFFVFCHSRFGKPCFSPQGLFWSVEPFCLKYLFILQFIIPNVSIETGADSLGLFNIITFQPPITSSRKVWICKGDAIYCPYLGKMKELQNKQGLLYL